MRRTMVRLGLVATGIAALAVGGTAGAATASGSGEGSRSVSGATVVSRQAAPAVGEQMSDAEIARYLAAFPPQKVAASAATPVGKDLEIDPDTGCLTRESAARFTLPEGSAEAVIAVGADVEMPNCWDLVRYLRTHPQG